MVYKRKAALEKFIEEIRTSREDINYRAVLLAQIDTIRMCKTSLGDLKGYELVDLINLYKSSNDTLKFLLAAYLDKTFENDTKEADKKFNENIMILNNKAIPENMYDYEKAELRAIRIAQAELIRQDLIFTALMKLMGRKNLLLEQEVTI